MTHEEELAARIGSYLNYFQDFKRLVFGAELSPFVGIDESKLALALSYYFKDRYEIKEEHQLDRLHRCKVAAHTIGWLIHFAPIFNVLTPEHLGTLEPEDQDHVLHANQQFAIYLAFQILDDELDPDDFREAGKFHDAILDLEGHMFLGSYNGEVASVMFAAMVAGTPAGPARYPQH